MANIKSQKKRILTNEKARQRNQATVSALKTQARKFRESLSSGDRAASGLNVAVPPSNDSFEFGRIPVVRQMPVDPILMTDDRRHVRLAEPCSRFNKGLQND